MTQIKMVLESEDPIGDYIESLRQYDRRGLPEIYLFENFGINKKINYKSAPCFLYGACADNIMKSVYKGHNHYGINRGYLDYSLYPNKDHRKLGKKQAPFK